MVAALAFAGMACGSPSGEWVDDLEFDGEGEAPRAVAALGGDGFVLVRYAPVPGADEHRVLASRDASFRDALTLPQAEPGAAVHEDLEPGEVWHYRVIALTGDEAGISNVVSAAPIESDLLSLWVEMDEGELAELYRRDVHSDERLEARVFVGELEGPELEVEGIRFRGSTTRTYAKKNFNIRLLDRPEIAAYPRFNFRSDQRRAGNRLVLNAMWTDPTAIREALSFAMYEALGLVAPRFEFVELFLNRSFEGLYVSLERIDRELMRGSGLEHRRGAHTLVRDESKAHRHLDAISRRSIFGANLDAVTASDEEALELLQTVFRYRGEVDDHDWAGLLDLIRWVHATSAGAAFEEGFRARFDVDAFMDVLAIHVLTHDRDSLDIDYWLYRNDVDEGPWLLIPWDKNLTFGHHYFGGFQGVNDFFDYDRSFVEAQQNALITKFLASPGLRADFDARLYDLATHVFDDGWHRAQIDALAAHIAPAMARLPDRDAYALHPGQHHGALGWWELHLRALSDFIRLRRAYVLAALGEPDEASTRGHRIVDEAGWVVAEFRPKDGREVELSVDVEELVEPSWRGIAREWRIEAPREVRGELTVYWRHTPVESWYGELVLPGDQFYLDGYLRDGEGPWQRVEGDVVPFSNRITLPVSVQGSTTLRVGYAPD
jgi:spore coat protein H